MIYISDVMYWISTGLLVPVVILRIYFFVRALILVGSFFGQYLAMKRTQRFVNSHLDRLTPDNLDDFVKSLPDNCNALVIPYIRKIVEAKGNRALTDRLLADFEIAVDKELSTPKTLGKLGPILGLMGTLIPMGPALAGLAQGDIASMAYNMQVAFATTVIGLVISAIGFIVLQMRQRWLFQDLTNLEYIAQL